MFAPPRLFTQLCKIKLCENNFLALDELRTSRSILIFVRVIGSIVYRATKINQDERTVVSIRWPLNNLTRFRVRGMEKRLCVWRLKDRWMGSNNYEKWPTDYGSRLEDCCSRQKNGSSWLLIDGKSVDIHPRKYSWRKTASTAILSLVLIRFVVVNIGTSRMGPTNVEKQ